MKLKKLSRPGVAILAALAPACALGVTVGVICSNITPKEQEIEEKDWIDRYDTINKKYLSDIEANNRYDTNDITSKKVIGTGITFEEKANLTLKDIKYKSIRVGPTMALPIFDKDKEVPIVLPTISAHDNSDTRLSSINKELAYYQKTYPNAKVKYTADDKTISVAILNGNTILIKRTFNNNGYITNYLSLEDNIQFTITYTIDPYKHS